MCEHIERDKKRFKAELTNLQPIIGFISNYAQKVGFSSLDKIQLACEEVVVNIINYAYCGKSGEVEISLNVASRNRINVEIRDWGVPFNPLSCQKADTSSCLEDRKIGGLGVFLACKIADKVEYKRKQNTNILTLSFS